MITASVHDHVAGGRRLAVELRDLRAAWNGRVSAWRGSAAWRLLVADGILVEFTDGRRNRAWRSPEVLTAPDDFAARPERRSTP